jgi:RNA polymerase sigma-70 factor (ECF subfamily)
MADEPHATRLLIDRAHAGDAAALGILVERHLEFVRVYVRGRLGAKLRAHDETQDLVHDALLDVLRHGVRLRVSDDDAFRRVLARIVENTLRDRGRWLQRERRSRDRERAIGADTVLDLDPPARAITRPSQHASADEEEAWVRLGLEFLEPVDREVIRLREWDGLSFPEIGRWLDTTEEGARKRFERAVVRLAARVLELRRGAVRDALRATEEESA